jgi:outer membrane lipoprotein-sorting protein
MLHQRKISQLEARPMTSVLIRLAVGLFFLASATTVGAQTADDVVEKSLAALGGRPAHAKLKSRLTTGTIVLSTPGGDIEGSIELLNAAPNKSRMLLKADLTSLGAGPFVLDQRFDGHSGYVLDSLQGNREVTGNQLDNLKNGSFPHPFLNYKDLGTKVELKGKEKVADREAYLLIFDPTSGSVMRQYVDAETFLPIRMVMTVNIPQLGQDVEQVTEFLDYKEVDGIKVPFRLRSSSSIQNFTITVSKLENNVKVDETLFVKPAQ